MSEFPRFNLQKNDISEKIKTLRKEADEIYNILGTRTGKLTTVKNRMKNFIKGVDNLAEDFKARKANFVKLAVSISEESDEVWKNKLNSEHEEGIFQWMHDQILELLTQRWNKLNLGSNGGPDEPPIYKEMKFENYKQIINNQNNKKRSINNQWGELERSMEPFMQSLETISKKVTPKAN